MVKICVALVGATGSGKSEVAKIITSNYPGSLVLRASDFIRKEMADLGLVVDGHSIRAYAQEMMRKNGPTYWSLKMIDSTVTTEMEMVVVDGVRNLGGIEGLRQRAGKLVIIGLVASKDVRLKRILERRRDIDNIPLADLSELIQNELRHGPAWGLEINECLQVCDYLIDADQSIDEVKSNVLSALSKVIPPTGEPNTP